MDTRKRTIEISRDVSFLDYIPVHSIKDCEDFLPRENDHRKSSNPPRDVNKAEGNEKFIEIDLVNKQDSKNRVNEEELETLNDFNNEGEWSDVEDFLGFLADDPRVATRRGRPRFVRTGLRGRPREVYGMTCSANEIDTEFAFLTETPISRAMNSQESDEWMVAMADEVNSILMKDTWSLVDRSKAPKVIGSRFVLCNKYDTNGVPKKRKARIVAKGYSQQYRKDFHETYAPVARLSSMRTTIAFAAQNDMNIGQYDIATAHLNGELDEQVFMEVPDWMENVLEHIISEKGNQDQFFNKAKTMLNELT